MEETSMLIRVAFVPQTASPSLPCSCSELDFEDLNSSRQSIEGRLVQEYKNSSYSSDTRSELDRIVQDKECSSCSKSRTITYNSSFLHQLRWVLKRTFQNLMLNPQTSIAEVVDLQCCHFICKNKMIALKRDSRNLKAVMFL